MIKNRFFALPHLALCLFVLLFTPLYGGFAQAELSPAEKAWGFDQSDLTPDPDIRYGLLSNGMRYAIRNNEKPEDTAVFQLVFDVGSLAESDDERGVAHFVEHMAFNGSTNVPEGEMVKILERFGLAFGADTNAYTTFERTGYTLDLPNTDPELLDTALFLLRETASEVSFRPEAVERERGVILSEMRSRENYALRNFMAQTAFLLPDAGVADRLPIGTAESIKSVSADALKQFYARHYAPEKTTLVIVGNIDVDAMEAKIRSTFSDWQISQTPPPSSYTGPSHTGTSHTGPTHTGPAHTGPAHKDRVDFARKGGANSFTDPAVSETAVFVTYAPYVQRADTIESRREALLRGMGYRIIGRRIGRAVRAGDAKFLAASIGTNDVFKIARETQFQVRARDGDLTAGIAEAEKIIRQALTYGFTQQEVDEQIAGYRNALENAARGAAARRNNALASQIVDAAFNNRMVTTPQARLARFEAVAQDISPDTLLQSVKDDLIDLSDPLVYITAKQPLDGGAETLRQAYRESRKVALAPPQARSTESFAYTSFGASGAVIGDTMIDDLGIRTIRFANNVRLNLKQTDFEEDRVRISLRIDGGDLLNTRQNPDATTLMRIYGSAGLKAHSVDDLISILAGRSVSFGLSSGSDYFGNYVTTTQQDVLLQFQLLAAYVIDAGYRPEALERYRQGFDNYYARLSATPGAALSSHIGGIISDNDPRFTLSPQEALEALDFDGLQNTIAPALASAPLEIGVVGDFDADKIIAAVAQTFGALPQRDNAPFEAETKPMRSFTADRTTRYIAHDGEPDQTVLRYYWPTSDDSDYPTEIRLSLLSQILQLRLTDEIREKLGASYSPGASSFMSSLYADFGYLSVGTNVDFDDRETVKSAIERIVESLKTEPASDDELLRATKPILERLRLRDTSNGAWLGIVDEAQSDLKGLDRYRSLPEMIANVSAEMLQQAAVKWLTEEPLIVEVVHRDAYAELSGDQKLAAPKQQGSALGATIAADNAKDK